MNLIKNIVASLIAISILLASAVTAQGDLGIRDTLRFEPANPTWTINSTADSTFSVEIWTWTDSQIDACSFPFIVYIDTAGMGGVLDWDPGSIGYSSTDSLIVIDSFVWISTPQMDSVSYQFVTASSLDSSLTQIEQKHEFGYNGALLGLITIPVQGDAWSVLPHETSSKIGDLYLTFLVDNWNAPANFTIVIDSLFFQPAGSFKLVSTGPTNGYAPVILPCSIQVTNSVLDADNLNSDVPVIPQTYELNQNYPNPFNPSTTISFYNVKTGHIKLDICNIVGQRIKTLLNMNTDIGWQEATWDGTDEHGVAVSSGIYFYRLSADGFANTKKMLLIK